MIEITNPVLPGFAPDPVLCRVGATFYVAVSTFEWFPGVQIFASENLVDWRLAARPLAERRLLDLQCVQSSAGVWAPCLTHRDGMFHMVYTVVHSWRGETPVDWGAFKDTPNFVVSAPSLDGPWSDPAYLNSSGFDPSLFHDDDGRSWLVNMQWDYRCRATFFAGIVLQEYDRAARSLVGPRRKIFGGGPIGLTEGPHLYKRKGWYYLMVAEGGTSYAHAVSLARSRDIAGPYELHPQNPLVNSFEDRAKVGEYEDVLRRGPWLSPADAARLPAGFWDRLQKAGHGSMCEIDGDEWLLAHLAARPQPGASVCLLGRETCLQRLKWFDDGWPRVLDAEGRPTRVAQTVVSLPLPPGAAPSPQRRDWSFRDDFDGPAPAEDFRRLRLPLAEEIRLDARPGWLSLTGRESPVSTQIQTVLAASVKHPRCEASTRVDFEPADFQQMAGLLVRYDERNQFYLRVSHDEEAGGRALGVVAFERGVLSLPLGRNEIPLPPGPVLLKAGLADAKLRFHWSPDAAAPDWRPVGPELDASVLSDEAAWPMGFTGAFVGLACHDMSGGGAQAHFDWFDYRELR